jgi:hypothetical protein
MTPKPIETPRGSVFVNANGKAELKWKADFAPKWTRRYSVVQRFVDSEVLRLSEPFIPFLTGTLIKTGILGTDVGSGLVQWIAPYSKRQYYKGRAPGTSSFGPLRGRLWFERMKEVNGNQIIEGARKLAGKS